MSDPHIYHLTVDNQVWEFTSVRGSSIWPSGDPCPNDGESLVTLRLCADKESDEQTT